MHHHILKTSLYCFQEGLARPPHKEVGEIKDRTLKLVDGVAEKSWRTRVPVLPVLETTVCFPSY